jgi:hypothetical protein
MLLSPLYIQRESSFIYTENHLLYIQRECFYLHYKYDAFSLTIQMIFKPIQDFFSMWPDYVGAMYKSSLPLCVSAAGLCGLDSRTTLFGIERIGFNKMFFKPFHVQINHYQ